MNQARRIYLDHNATTPLGPEVAAAMAEAHVAFGNPSSIHQEGRRARDLVETARQKVAELLATRTEEIVFTSSGTEADQLGIIGLYRIARASGQTPRILCAAIEHPAVLGAVAALGALGDGAAEQVPLAVSRHGAIDLAALDRELERGAAVVACALANHELGTLQEIGAIAALCRAHGALLHVDAVQAVGRIKVAPEQLGADTLALSGHKLYGPKGIGALWIRRGLDLGPLVPGGHQERERRAGTENVPGIAGLGVAATLATAERETVGEHLAAVQAALEAGLLEMGAEIHGRGHPRVPGVTLAGFPGARGELVVQALDLAGVAASTGAACTSGTLKPSPVLLALGCDKGRALEAVRLSAGRGTTLADVQQVLELLPPILSRVRRFA